MTPISKLEKHVVIHWVPEYDPPPIEQLLEYGVEFIENLGYTRYLCRIPADARQAVQAKPFVSTIEPFSVEHKITEDARKCIAVCLESAKNRRRGHPSTISEPPVTESVQGISNQDIDPQIDSHRVAAPAWSDDDDSDASSDTDEYSDIDADNAPKRGVGTTVPSRPVSRVVIRSPAFVSPPPFLDTPSSTHGADVTSGCLIGIIWHQTREKSVDELLEYMISRQLIDTTEYYGASEYGVGCTIQSMAQVDGILAMDDVRRLTFQLPEVPLLSESCDLLNEQQHFRDTSVKPARSTKMLTGRGQTVHGTGSGLDTDGPHRVKAGHRLHSALNKILGHMSKARR